MANDYTGIKQVRETNGQKFIDDFNTISTIVVYAHATKVFITVLKQDVWSLARLNKIGYTLSKDVFANSREVMVIV